MVYSESPILADFKDIYIYHILVFISTLTLCPTNDTVPNFCPIDFFSPDMNFQVYEGNLQLFPATKKANLDVETDVGNLTFSVKCIFML